jgi:hypothetical protein
MKEKELIFWCCGKRIRKEWRKIIERTTTRKKVKKSEKKVKQSEIPGEIIWKVKMKDKELIFGFMVTNK